MLGQGRANGARFKTDRANMRARSPRSGRSLRRQLLSPSYRLATRVPLVDRRPRIRTCFDITPQRADLSATA